MFQILGTDTRKALESKLRLWRGTSGNTVEEERVLSITVVATSQPQFRIESFSMMIFLLLGSYFHSNRVSVS